MKRFGVFLTTFLISFGVMAADIFNFTDLWNSGSTTFNAIKVTITDTGSAADSNFIHIIRGANVFRIDREANIILTGFVDGRDVDADGTKLDGIATGAQIGDLLADGSVPLTANWDVGAFSITGLRFVSDQATGTAPFTVASTTLVSNLNADLLDGFSSTAFASAGQGTLADSATQPGDNISTLTNDSGFTDDQTGAEIKTAYEVEVSAFTDAQFTKLAGIETGAEVNVAIEGTAVLSTGEVGGTKFLREDGDNTSSWQSIPGGGDALTSNPLSQFAATTSLQFKGVISDETGSGKVVFATSPALVTPTGIVTNDVAESTDKNYVSDAESTVIGNTSGTNTGDQTNVSGSAGTVTSIGDLTGHITSTNRATLLGSFTAAQLSTALSDVTFSGNNSGDQTNISGNAATVTTNADLTGIVTSTGNATAIADKAIAIAKLADGTDGELITWSAAGVIETVAVGTAAQVLTSNGVGAAPTFQNAASSDLVDDLTPQLGGDLDVNGNSIVSVSAGSIAITPDTTGDIILDGLLWPQADGTAGFFLQTDGATQLSWANAAGAGDMATATYDPAGISEQLVGLTATQELTNKLLNDFTNVIDADALHVQVRNESGSTIVTGQPVYISGYSVGQDLILVQLADASDPTKMPAFGIVEVDILNNATGEVDVSGRIAGLDTSMWSVANELYVDTAVGQLTATRPTGSSNVQKIGIVLRSHASLGVIEVVGAGRSNDIPNAMLDSIVRIVDDGDITKQIAFQASGITTSTTRTITMPDEDVTIGKPTESFIIAISDETTDLTTGTKVTFRMPYAFTASAVRASLTTAATGSLFIVDIQESGVTVLSTNITIDISEKTSTTAATPPVISDPSWADDAEMTIIIDQIGSSDAGGGGKVTIIGERT